MKLLIIGGTRFLGRHLAAAALAAGHELTLLHRGRSNPGLFPEARHVVVPDRKGDLSALTGGPWDAVIDTCAYVPRDVNVLADALVERTARYLLVSTVSVYRETPPEGIDESGALATLDDPATEAVTGETYGALKALCEQAAVQRFGSAATLVARPGLIVGPHDPTERFTWWVRRVHQGGRFVAPGPAGAHVQFIDARDLADWLLLQAVQGTTGVFNLCGPDRALTWGEWIDSLVATLQPTAQPIWMAEPALLDAGVQPWMGLPLWLPAAEAGLHRAAIGRALATGLRTRPLADTLRDTLAWALAQPAPAAGGPGLDLALEARLLGRLKPVHGPSIAADRGSAVTVCASSHTAVTGWGGCLQCTHRNTEPQQGAHHEQHPPHPDRRPRPGRLHHLQPDGQHQRPGHRTGPGRHRGRHAGRQHHPTGPGGGGHRQAHHRLTPPAPAAVLPRHGPATAGPFSFRGIGYPRATPDCPGLTMSIAHRVRVKQTVTRTDHFNRVINTTLDWLRSDGRWQEQQRETVDHGDGAAILLYEPHRHTVVLVRQFRYATFVNGHDGLFIEVPAGLLDAASPEDCIRAEAEQEVGFAVRQPKRVFDTFMSPGSLTERVHCFVAEYDARDRIAPGGGLEHEGEDIEVLELPFAEAMAMVADGRIRDAKTILLLQHAALHLFTSRAAD